MCKLLNKTLELLESSDKSVAEIAVGADVNVNWLLSLKYGKPTVPGVDKVERLYEFLSGKTLEV